MKKFSLLPLSLALCLACSPAGPSDGSGGSSGGKGGSGGSTGGRGGSSGGSGGSSSTGGSGGATGGSGGATGGSGGASGGSGGATGGSGGSGGSTGGSGGSGGSTGGSGGSGGSTGGSGGSPGDGGGSETPSGGGAGGDLDGAFLDVKCATGRSGGFCRPEMMGIKNVMFKMGGEAGKMYDVKLKVTAIVEGMAYTGGMPVDTHFYIGGRGTTANYGVCGLEVGMATYFINRHMQAGGDSTRKFEYTTPAIKIPGQSMVTLFCRDTNNHLTMNSERGRHVIAMPPPELAAKIGMQPVEGHFVYLKVESSTPSP